MQSTTLTKLCYSAYIDIIIYIMKKTKISCKLVFSQEDFFNLKKSPSLAIILSYAKLNILMLDL